MIVEPIISTKGIRQMIKSDLESGDAAPSAVRSRSFAGEHLETVILIYERVRTRWAGKT